MKKKIFITRRLQPEAKTLLGRYFDVDEYDELEPIAPERLPGLAAAYDAILCTVSDRFTKDVLAQKNRLEVLSNCAIGLDNIDVDYAKSRGIAVYNTPGVVTESTADMTFALLLSLARKVFEGRDYVRKGQWTFWNPGALLGTEIDGKTLGIIGFGEIGKAVARRAVGFGMHILYYDPYVEQDGVNTELPARKTGFEEILSESDFITVHVPLTDETQGMIDSAAFSAMKKMPLFINMARGPVVNTADIVQALESGKIAAAALDVTDPEPLPADHPLCAMDNCLVVPHIGTSTLECRRNMARLAAENIINHYGKNAITR